MVAKILYYHSVSGSGIDKGNHSVSRSWNWWKYWFSETEVRCITVLYPGIQQ